MNPEIKIKWLAALRSGEYKQSKRFLRSDKGYCCLGVLREIQAPQATYENEQTANLYPEHRAGLDWDQMDMLANMMNDKQGRSFVEIADFIEGHL